MAIKEPMGGSVPHRHARKQEARTARRLGATAVKGSGCGDVRGDSRIHGLLRIENKCTTHKSFSITTEIIEKIEEAALGAGELPVIEIEMLNARGEVLHRMAVMPVWALDQLVDKANDSA